MFKGVNRYQLFQIPLQIKNLLLTSVNYNTFIILYKIILPDYLTLINLIHLLHLFFDYFF